jgi:cell division protein FtsW
MFFAWLAILTLGVVMVASASVTFGETILLREFAFLAIALGALAFTLVVPLVVWRNLYFVAWATAVLLCALVLVPGVGIEVNGARRWIGIGAGSIQAAEVAKGMLIVFLAGWLHRNGGRIESGQRLLVLVAMFTLPALLILVQPDFGSVVVLAAVLIGVVFVAGARLRHFALSLFVGVAVLGLIAIAQPYRLERLVSFTDPWATAFGSGYQLTQALIAFGRGEVFGLGLGEGIQKLFYLPEAHNDFIFAIIAEELGIIGATAVLALLALLSLRILRSGRRALARGDLFAGYLCYGTGLLFAIQTVINVGVNTGLLPTKGLTLPFVSFGGNSLIVSCVLLGMVARSMLEGGRSHG